MPPSLPIEVADLAGGDWASCLLPRAVRADASTDEVHRFNARVPHFMTCRNASCVRDRHSGRYTPVGPRKHAYGAGPPGAPSLGESISGQRVDAIDEHNCATSTADVAAVIDAHRNRSIPLVLRGCAAGLPAISRWRSNGYLRGKGATANFAALLGGGDGYDVAALDASLAGDLVADQKQRRVLRDFSALLLELTSAPEVWTSKGGKKPAVHADTFDNLHVVISGEKRFFLVSPRYAREMYVDYPPLARPDATGDDEIECPGQGSVGCDELGCFTYVPFDADRVDLGRYPRVRDAAVRHAVVRATDTLFIPALWFHRILHHPRVERADARNIALTFTRQPPMPELLPFAAGLTRYWSDRRLHACEAPT